jgi:hypothetical protein
MRGPADARLVFRRRLVSLIFLNSGAPDGVVMAMIMVDRSVSSGKPEITHVEDPR